MFTMAPITKEVILSDLVLQIEVLKVYFSLILPIYLVLIGSASSIATELCHLSRLRTVDFHANLKDFKGYQSANFQNFSGLRPGPPWGEGGLQRPPDPPAV